MTKCPTCGRRPSERHGGILAAKQEVPFDCPDPIHARADACEDMAALLRRFVDGMDDYSKDSWMPKFARIRDEARALLARLKGEGHE